MRALIQTIRADFSVDPRFFAFVGIVGGLFSLIAGEWLLLWAFANLFIGAAFAHSHGVRDALDEQSQEQIDG